MPVRVQRKRSKGWRMPPNTVSVTRPGRWGNPFKVVGEEGHWFIVYGEEPFCSYSDKKEAVQDAVLYFEQHIPDELIQQIKKELKGKNLACFCKEGEPCHADVLLKIANEERADVLTEIINH